MDVRFASSVVASVNADPFSKKFLDDRLKLRAVVRQLEAVESDVGGLQAAR